MYSLSKATMYLGTEEICSRIEIQINEIDKAPEKTIYYVLQKKPDKFQLGLTYSEERRDGQVFHANPNPK